jgi:DNA invertase Pin-like site-specific DNA recombinase
MTVHAAIYARTSPDCPLSANEQIERLRTIAAERDWTVVHVTTDRPTSVKKGQDRRPGELALIETVRSGGIDVVLLWSIDRIGKSLVELVGFMETCRSAGVAVYLDQERIDSAKTNGLSLFDLTSMMALHLRQSRRDRILRGQVAARAVSIKFGRPPIAKPKVKKAKQGGRR